VQYAEIVHYRAIYDVLQGQWSLSVTSMSSFPGEVFVTKHADGTR
jgi:hypothetical protein